MKKTVGWRTIGWRGEEGRREGEEGRRKERERGGRSEGCRRCSKTVTDCVCSGEKCNLGTRTMQHNDVSDMWLLGLA